MMPPVEPGGNFYPADLVIRGCVWLHVEQDRAITRQVGHAGARLLRQTAF
ncbi:hypothetical protein [Komagataeibacter xylinus]|nr:hypothetical protein [Komagataeibacter xylinus]